MTNREKLQYLNKTMKLFTDCGAKLNTNIIRLNSDKDVANVLRQLFNSVNEDYKAWLSGVLFDFEDETGIKVL